MVQWYNGTMSNERRSMQTSSTPRSDALQQPKECFATVEGMLCNSRRNHSLPPKGGIRTGVRKHRNGEESLKKERN